MASTGWTAALIAEPIKTHQKNINLAKKSVAE
jgi:hypothetical protein